MFHIGKNYWTTKSKKKKIIKIVQTENKNQARWGTCNPHNNFVFRTIARFVYSLSAFKSYGIKKQKIKREYILKNQSFDHRENN